MQTVSGILCSVFNKSFPQCNSSPNTNSQNNKTLHELFIWEM